MEASGICAHTRTDNHPSSAKYLNHSHDSYEIFLLTDGNCTFQVTDSRYHLPHGSLMLFRRGELHRLLPEGNAPLAYGYLQFTREAIPPEPALLEAIDRLFENRQDGCNNLLTPTAASLSFLQMCIRRMSVAASEDPLPLFLCYLRPLIRELLLCGTPLSGEIHRVQRTNSHGDLLFEQVCAYISAHFDTLKDLGFISDRFHYSTVYVNGLFRQRLGVSVWQYVLHKRIDRACDLILDGMRVEKAALCCGFEDYSTFYRIFRKNYGITPSVCRKNGSKPRLVRH